MFKLSLIALLVLPIIVSASTSCENAVMDKYSLDIVSAQETCDKMDSSLLAIDKCHKDMESITIKAVKKAQPISVMGEWQLTKLMNKCGAGLNNFF